jgi:SAM-dependent methyltransferase
MSATYVFDEAWSAERDRIGSLEAMLDPGTEAVLDAVGVAPGWRCLEVGAGAGSTARWLADRVGPDGHVLATDVQVAFLEPLARPTLEVRRHDMCVDGPPGTDFDLVHVRWMLHWPPRRAAAVRQMVQCLRAGGWLVAEEPDCASLLGGCLDPAVTRVLAAALEVLSDLGGGMDPGYGHRLFHDMAGEGLVDLGSQGRTHMLRGADPATGASWLRHTVAKVRDIVVGRGAATAGDVEHCLVRLDDPAFATVAPTTMAVWGRLPD